MHPVESRNLERQQPAGAAAARVEVARARAARPPRAAGDEAQGRGLPGRHVPRLRLFRHLQRPIRLQRRRDPLARAAERRQLGHRRPLRRRAEARARRDVRPAASLEPVRAERPERRLRQVSLQARVARGAARAPRRRARAPSRAAASSATSTSRPTTATSTIPPRGQGKVLCTPAERAALAAICELGLRDAFRLFEQPEKVFSWWDYRAGAFRRNQGLRIDLVLASQSVKSNVHADAGSTRSRAAGSGLRTTCRSSQNSPPASRYVTCSDMGNPANLLDLSAWTDLIDADRRRTAGPTQRLRRDQHRAGELRTAGARRRRGPLCRAVPQHFVRFRLARLPRFRARVPRPRPELPRGRHDVSRHAAHARHDARARAPHRGPRDERRARRSAWAPIAPSSRSSARCSTTSATCAIRARRRRRQRRRVHARRT